MAEQFILGAIQGIAEWLPVSSEGILVLVSVNLLGPTTNIEQVLQNALFLHLGTFFAALIYFWSDVVGLTKTLLSTKHIVLKRLVQNSEEKIVDFLVISTIISGVLGLIVLMLITTVGNQLDFTGTTITLLVGFLLLITGMLQVRAKQGGLRKEKDLKRTDSIILGILQGFATLPGLSRSGFTMSGLLLRKFNSETALKLSFLMSLPIVLIGNIVLNLGNASTLTLHNLVGILSSFAFGLLTIHILLTVTKRVNFGYFVLGFGAITILFGLV